MSLLALFEVLLPYIILRIIFLHTHILCIYASNLLVSITLHHVHAGQRLISGTGISISFGVLKINELENK